MDQQEKMQYDLVATGEIEGHEIKMDPQEKMRYHLVATGEIERLKLLLKTLLDDSGWRDTMKKHCTAIVKTKGINNVTVDDLVKEITSIGRKEVSSEVKKELLNNIQEFFKKREALIAEEQK